MYTFDKKTTFSVEGSRWRRLNPDGTYPAVDNQLGFVGTVDLSAILAGDKLSYRLGATGDFSDLVIDMTGSGGTPAATTVAEAVITLNGDTTGFAVLFTASADATTGRLKIIEKLDTATYLELKGALAVALEFGAWTNGVGFGTHFYDCFDNAGAIGFPKETKDFEEIEVENGDGSVMAMTTAALLKGLNISLALNDEGYELKQMIMGGTMEEDVTGITARYTPPNTSQTYLPGFCGEVFETRYGKGSSNRSSMTGYKRTNLLNCVGMEGDLATEVKSWATYQFNIRVREYLDSSDVKHAGYNEDQLTIAQFTALGITFG